MAASDLDPDPPPPPAASDDAPVSPPGRKASLRQRIARRQHALLKADWISSYA